MRKGKDGLAQLKLGLRASPSRVTGQIGPLVRDMRNTENLGPRHLLIMLAFGMHASPDVFAWSENIFVQVANTVEASDVPRSQSTS